MKAPFMLYFPRLFKLHPDQVLKLDLPSVKSSTGKMIERENLDSFEEVSTLNQLAVGFINQREDDYYTFGAISEKLDRVDELTSEKLRIETSEIVMKAKKLYEKNKNKNKL